MDVIVVGRLMSRFGKYAQKLNNTPNLEEFPEIIVVRMRNKRIKKEQKDGQDASVLHFQL